MEHRSASSPLLQDQLDASVALPPGWIIGSVGSRVWGNRLTRAETRGDELYGPQVLPLDQPLPYGIRSSLGQALVERGVAFRIRMPVHPYRAGRPGTDQLRRLPHRLRRRGSYIGFVEVEKDVGGEFHMDLGRRLPDGNALGDR